MTVEIRYDFGCKAVDGKSSKYGHTFGNAISYDGILPIGCSVPVHLLFRLDLSDPNLPIVMDNGLRFLPLFFAFSYDATPMSYRVCSDSAIEILSVDNMMPMLDFPYPEYPREFDPVPVVVESISYAEQRDIALAWYMYSHPDIYEAIPEDEIRRLKACGYPVTRIGRVHDLLQTPRGEPCPYRHCNNHNKTHCLTTIATIPERPLRGLDLWRADGPTIQIVYELCKLCGCIRTYNTCT